MQADGFRERSTGCLPSPAEAVGLLRLASVEPFVASRHLRAAIPDAECVGDGLDSRHATAPIIKSGSPKIMGQVTSAVSVSLGLSADREFDLGHAHAR